MVMGMGRGVFYLSHILMAFAKAAIAIVVNCIPFFMFLPVSAYSSLQVKYALQFDYGTWFRRAVKREIDGQKCHIFFEIENL